MKTEFRQQRDPDKAAPATASSCPAGPTDAAQALVASELRYRRLFESAKDGILILDADTGMVVDANPFLTDMLGFSRAEFLGKRVWELGFRNNLTRQLLAFASKQTIAPEVLDLNDAVAGMLKLLRRMIGENVKLTWRLDADLPSVKIDPSQVDQILANLCVNARDAIAETGEIVIETGRAMIDAADCADHAEANPGTYAWLAVNDNGEGIDKETLALIFEPFVTTKDIGKDIGLGLATVYGIARQNKGFVAVDSELGKGTSFKVYLPDVAAETVVTGAIGKPESPKGHGETILLVEDEKPVRVACSLLLESLGYRVLAAETPGEALTMTTGHSGDIRLLLADVVMPEMDGRQLATRIAEMQPHIKTLYMSGYTANVIARRNVLDEDVQFMPKPFTRSDLARRVRDALDSVSPAGTNEKTEAYAAG